MHHKEVQGNMAGEMACQEVQETLLGATSQQNQQLQAQLSL
jgi:hypothetical protein